MVVSLMTDTFSAPDQRGEFTRGWDHGRNVDSGRDIRTYQADQIKAHTHPYYAAQGTTGSGSTGAFGGGSFSTYVPSTGSTGGAQNLVRNVARMKCVKY
jgi:microcystin-dependent protein